MMHGLGGGNAIRYELNVCGKIPFCLEWDM
jgi:hypothetical protein